MLQNAGTQKNLDRDHATHFEICMTEHRDEGIVNGSHGQAVVEVWSKNTCLAREQAVTHQLKQEALASSALLSSQSGSKSGC